MNLFRSRADRELEQLSAYLDGALSPSEAARLERRLQTELDLNRRLAELRATRALLRGLPARPVPRNFTLRPDDVGAPARARPAPGGLRWASALVAIALAVVLVGDVITGLGARAFRAAAPAPELAVAEEEMAAEAPPAAAEPELDAEFAEAERVEEPAAEAPAVEAPAPAQEEAPAEDAAAEDTIVEEAEQPEAALAGGEAGAVAAEAEAEAADEEPVAESEVRTRETETALPVAPDTPTVEPSPTLQPTATAVQPTPTAQPASPEPALEAGLPLLRWIELGLGALLIVLLALTFVKRKT